MADKTRKTVHTLREESPVGHTIIGRGWEHHATLPVGSRQSKMLALAIETVSDILADVTTEFTGEQWREYVGAKTLIEKMIPPMPRGAAVDPENAILASKIDAVMSAAIAECQKILSEAPSPKRYVMAATATKMASKVSSVRKPKAA